MKFKKIDTINNVSLVWSINSKNFMRFGDGRRKHGRDSME